MACLLLFNWWESQQKSYTCIHSLAYLVRGKRRIGRIRNWFTSGGNASASGKVRAIPREVRPGKGVPVTWPDSITLKNKIKVILHRKAVDTLCPHEKMVTMEHTEGYSGDETSIM